jgi:hypothetical protein
MKFFSQMLLNSKAPLKDSICISKKFKQVGKAVLKTTSSIEKLLPKSHKSNITVPNNHEDFFQRDDFNIKAKNNRHFEFQTSDEPKMHYNDLNVNVKNEKPPPISNLVTLTNMMAYNKVKFPTLTNDLNVQEEYLIHAEDYFKRSRNNLNSKKDAENEFKTNFLQQFPARLNKMQHSNENNETFSTDSYQTHNKNRIVQNTDESKRNFQSMDENKTWVIICLLTRF